MLNARLKVVGGKHDGQMIPLTSHKFLIGREQDCHLRTNSDLVSRHHCVFAVDDYAVRVRDLGSTNGTLVNGERVRGEVLLRDGDRVRVGKLDFEVLLAEAAAETESPAEVLPAVDGVETTELSASDTVLGMPVQKPTGDTDLFRQPEQPPAPAYAPAPAQAPPGYYQQPGAFYPPPGYYPQQPGPYPPMGAYPPPGQYPPPGSYPPGYYPQQGAYPPPGAAPGAPPASGTGELPAVRLPDPESTGLAPEAELPGSNPPAPSAEGGAPQELTPAERAAQIIKSRMQRR